MDTQHIIINAHLLSGQAGYRSAGIHGYIYHLLAHLPEAAPDWRFTALVGDGHPPQVPGLKTHRTRWAARSPLYRIAWEQGMMPRQVHHLEANLVHGTAFVNPLRLPVPGVITVHDLSFLRFPQALGRARRTYLQQFTRRSCEQAAHIIAVSASTARDVQQLLGIPEEKISIVVHGRGEEFRPLPEADIAAFRERPDVPARFILHVGTLEPRKNLPLLLRAYAGLPTALRQDVHLVLIGGRGWDYAPIFQTIEQHDLSEYVHLAGYVPTQELPFWYNAADILVFPSVYEGWGFPIVEAMACGCPIVISNSSSLPEAAGAVGLHIAPDDEIAWRDALEHALTDTAWQAGCRQAGIVRAASFSWARTAQETIAVYRHAIKQ